jgi:outer membrane protein assembly factor BamB
VRTKLYLAVALVWMAIATLGSLCRKQSAPDVPSAPTGPGSGEPGVSYVFRIAATDPDGGQVCCKFDWGDGALSPWSRYVAGGTEVSFTHKWNADGSYAVKAFARDEQGSESDWSSPLTVIIAPYTARGTLRWKYGVGPGVDFYTSPAVGPDGTIYVTSWFDTLYAVGSSGSLLWKVGTWGAPATSSPCIGPDGVVYAGLGNTVCCIVPDSGMRWQTVAGGTASAVALTSDSTVYVGSTSARLIAVGSDGSVRWRYRTGGSVLSSPAVGADGTVYFGSDDRRLHAVYPDSSPKWTYLTGREVQSSPAVDADGVVYVGSNDLKLHAVNPDGSPRWQFATAGLVISSPVVGSDGTIYVGSYDDRLYAIEPGGSQKWTFLTGGDIDASPTIASDGTIYVGSCDSCIYAVSAAGALVWKYRTGGKVGSSAAIGDDGTVYVCSDDGYLYAIYGSGTLADSPWPKFRHDNCNTGRVGGP